MTDTDNELTAAQALKLPAGTPLIVIDDRHGSFSDDIQRGERVYVSGVADSYEPNISLQGKKGWYHHARFSLAVTDINEREIQCPHKLPISQCPEHLKKFQEVLGVQLTDINNGQKLEKFSSLHQVDTSSERERLRKELFYVVWEWFKDNRFYSNWRTEDEKNEWTAEDFILITPENSTGSLAMEVSELVGKLLQRTDHQQLEAKTTEIADASGDVHELLMAYGKVCAEQGELSDKAVRVRMDIAAHFRDLHDEVEAKVAESYLTHFSYVDWEVGNDDRLRLGDYINCNHQRPHDGYEQNFEGQIVPHHVNGLPVVIHNVDPNDPDNSGDYADLQGLLMDGWEFTRIAQLTPTNSEDK